MKTMLIMTDFSDAAFRAAIYGCELCGSLGIKRIVLYHAYQPVLAYAGSPEMIGPGVDDQQQLYDDSMKELSLLKDRLAEVTMPGISIDCTSGDTAFTMERGKQEGIDLIVMGASGKSGLEKFVLGSTTIQVLKKGEWPVLIVPEEAKLGKGISNILLACDLKEVDKLPALTLYEFLDAFGGKLDLVNVEPEGTEKFAPHIDKAITDLHKLLLKYNPVFHYINGKEVADAILRFAKDQDTSLVIAVHQHRGFIVSLFHKSVTKQLMYKSTVPLLCLPGWEMS